MTVAKPEQRAEQGKIVEHLRQPTSVSTPPAERVVRYEVDHGYRERNTSATDSAR